jgi:hypothetical protein
METLAGLAPANLLNHIIGVFTSPSLNPMALSISSKWLYFPALSVREFPSTASKLQF